MSSEEEKPSIDSFECSECKKTFRYVSHFQRHILTHSNVRPFTCNHCGKGFKRIDALATHERTHFDELPFQCSQHLCTERFASKAALRYHELRHQNQTEFICDIDGCTKRFLTLGQLKQHHRTKVHLKSSVDAFYLKNQLASRPRRSYLPDGDVADPSMILSQSEKELDIKLSDEEMDIPQEVIDYHKTHFGDGKGCMSVSNEEGDGRISSSSSSAPSSDEGRTFLDDFNKDEQLFIDHIWKSIQQEPATGQEPINGCVNNKTKVQSNGKDSAEPYPLTKKRRLNSQEPVSAERVSTLNEKQPSHLLMEFSNLSGSSSFGKLKQELRIIVGLINKIKQEDDEAGKVSNDQQEDEAQEKGKSEKVKLKRGFSVKAEDEMVFHKLEDHRDPTGGYYFYQNDSNPFHDYRCEHLHKNLPKSLITDKAPPNSSSVSEPLDKNQSDCVEDRPLLEKKILTAVRLVQHCKQTFLSKRRIVDKQSSASSSAFASTSATSSIFTHTSCSTQKKKILFSEKTLLPFIPKKEEAADETFQHPVKQSFDEVALPVDNMPPFYPNFVTLDQLPVRFQQHTDSNIFEEFEEQENDISHIGQQQQQQQHYSNYALPQLHQHTPLQSQMQQLQQHQWQQSFQQHIQAEQFRYQSQNALPLQFASNQVLQQVSNEPLQLSPSIFDLEEEIACGNIFDQTFFAFDYMANFQ